jgi:diguanylate cyclase (GGDEF)-like protein
MMRVTATMLFGGFLLAAAPTGVAAAAPPTDDPTLYDDPTFYDDPTLYDDPTFYDDPTLYDDSIYFDSTYDPADPNTIWYDESCDPAVNPGWASDPYCNVSISEGVAIDPSFFDDTVPPALLALDDGRSIVDLSGRAGSADTTPLTDFDTDDAPIVGAGRMLLAIDALAELGAFERAVTPEGAALLREIREGVPAGGLDEDGYVAELERFADDFIPYLLTLESDGVPVSDDLWAAADALEIALDSDDQGTPPPFLIVRPWISGLADLLRRGGIAGDPPNSPADTEAIRGLLAGFRPVIAENTFEPDPSPSIAPPGADPADDSNAAAGGEDNPAADLQTRPLTPEPSRLPILAIASAVLAALAVLAFLFFRRRSTSAEPAGDPVPHPDPTSHPVPGSSGGTLDRDGPAATGSAKAADPTATPSTPSVADLLDASRRMTSSLDVTAIGQIALTEALRLVKAEGGIIVRRSPVGLDPVSCEPPVLFNYDHIADGCLPRVIETGRSTTAIATDEPMLVEVPMAMGAVPIVADGVITGAILVVRVSAKPFDRDEIDALDMLAPLVGSAFAAADTHETATELVDVEPLTGLQNRRRLDLDLASISAEDQVAYVMVDIDHFKNFNDTNGHAAGDEALRTVSSILAASVRPNDLVYRYGGEEFCVLLPGATSAEAAEVAERARDAVEQASIPGMENQPAGCVTISIGVSDSAWGTPDDLVERADAALYEAKRSGRNRVNLHQPD